MTTAAQISERRKRELELAKEAGWESVSDFVLAARDGYVEFPKCPQSWAEYRAKHNPSKRKRSKTYQPE